LVTRRQRRVEHANVTTRRTDLERLELFRRKAKELKSRRIVTSGRVTFKFSISLSRPEEYTINVDEDDFLAMLVQLRPFTLEGEDVYFPGVHNVLIRQLTDETLQRAAIENRQTWKLLFNGWGFGRFSVSGSKTYGRGDFFALAMNARIFHHDLEKEREYESLPRGYRSFAEAALYDVGLSAIIIVLSEADVIETAFQQKALKGLGDGSVS
jgi:hypothetical protein